MDKEHLIEGPNLSLPPLHPVEVAERAVVDTVGAAPVAQLPAPVGPVADPTAPPSPPPAPVNTNTHTPLIYVAFAYDTKKGKQRHDRMWAPGFVDLRRLNDVIQLEAMIAEQKKLDNVRILSWQPLEG